MVYIFFLKFEFDSNWLLKSLLNIYHLIKTTLSIKGFSALFL